MGFTQGELSIPIGETAPDFKAKAEKYLSLAESCLERHQEGTANGAALPQYIGNAAIYDMDGAIDVADLIQDSQTISHAFCKIVQNTGDGNSREKVLDAIFADDFPEHLRDIHLSSLAEAALISAPDRARKIADQINDPRARAQTKVNLAKRENNLEFMIEIDAEREEEGLRNDSADKIIRNFAEESDLQLAVRANSRMVSFRSHASETLVELRESEKQAYVLSLLQTFGLSKENFRLEIYKISAIIPEAVEAISWFSDPSKFDVRHLRRMYDTKIDYSVEQILKIAGRLHREFFSAEMTETASSYMTKEEYSKFDKCKDQLAEAIRKLNEQRNAQVIAEHRRTVRQGVAERMG